MQKFAGRTLIRVLPEGDIFAALLKSDFIPLPSAVVRREAYWAVGGIDSRLRYSEDFDLFVKIAQIYTVRAVQEVVCLYRIHGGNLCLSMGDGGFQEGLTVVRRYLPLATAKRALTYHHTYHAVGMIKAGKFSRGFVHLIRDGGLWVAFSELAKRLFGKVSPKA